MENDDPNRNRWFTELNSMVIFHGKLWNNQMVYGEHPMVFWVRWFPHRQNHTSSGRNPASPPSCPSNLGPVFFGRNLSHRTIPVTLILLLVGGDWNMNFIFPYIGNVIIPIDELIFFRGVAQPPTSSHFNGIISNVMKNCLWNLRNSEKPLASLT